MTENTPAANTSNAVSERRGIRRPIIAVGLAALAVGGIGAAITSAAWTDNAFFSAPAAAATFSLQGSLDGKTWNESNNPDSIQLVIPAEEFANLLPGQTRTVDLWVRNQGSVSAALTSSVAVSSTSTFVQNPSTSVSGLAAILTPSNGTGASDQFELTITTPADWSSDNRGATGTVIVTIAATAVA
jgi:hypothetical protein